MDDVENKLFKPPGECMNTDKEENRKMREKISNSPTSSCNEYYEESWRRFRKSYDVKNKYHPIGESHYFGDFQYDSNTWNEPMLTAYHKTIRLEKRKQNGKQPESTLG